MLQGPGMHAVSIKNNEIHEYEPWKQCLVRALGEKILPKYLIQKLALKKSKQNQTSPNKLSKKKLDEWGSR